MKITANHRAFWLQHNAPAFMREGMRTASIDSLIPSERLCSTIHNTIYLIGRKPRGGEELREYLVQLVNFPQCSDPGKRSAFANRILKRLEKGE